MCMVAPLTMVAGISWELNTPAGYFISVGRLNHKDLYERGMKGFKCGVIRAEMTRIVTGVPSRDEKQRRHQVPVVMHYRGGGSGIFRLDSAYSMPVKKMLEMIVPIRMEARVTTPTSAAWRSLLRKRSRNLRASGLPA